MATDWRRRYGTLIVAGALIAAIAAVVRWRRGAAHDGSDDPVESAGERRPGPPPRIEAERPPEDDLDPEVTNQPVGPAAAKPANVPIKEVDPTENVPSLEESEQMHARVLARIDQDIAAARARGDQAAVERLEVRRARLERKRSGDVATKPDAAPARP